MDIIFVLAVVIFIEKSCSQTLSQSSSCYADGGTLNLNCNTADLADTITFLLNGNAKGGCFSGTCAPNIVQSGTITTITLSPFSSSTHSGNWTCSYGLSVSPEVVVAENPCTTTPIPTTTPTPTTTPISSTTPSTSLQKCFGFIELKSCRYPNIGLIVFVILVVSLAIGGVIYWKRNQKKTSLQKKKHSDRGTEKMENTRSAQEMQNK